MYHLKTRLALSLAAITLLVFFSRAFLADHPTMSVANETSAHIQHAENNLSKSIVMPPDITISGIVNLYTPVISFANCDSSRLQTGSAAGFFPGDKVLIIQMQGATVNLSNTSGFGNILNLGNAGNYEFNRVSSIAANQIDLQYKVEKKYNVSGKVQLIRVPEYTDVTATGLSCKAWDGSTGGVLAIDVAGTLTILGSGIDVSEKGFRGGLYIDSNNPAYHQTGYVFSPNPDIAAAKGEGIAVLALNQSYGCGKSANGGGGGNAHNAGGGGGGNAGAGGNGGMEYYNTPGTPTLNTNGLGGVSPVATAIPRAIMGGGGGAGHGNDNVGSSGGNGGGIMLIRAQEVAGTNSRMVANGQNIFGPGGDNVNDGQGGGGAGGTIVLDAQNISGNLDIEAKGGRGGDCLFYVNSQIIGPGGGGGGGRVMFSQPLPNINLFLDGGINGIANQNMTNQAQPGGIGVSGSNFSIPVYYEDTIPAGLIHVSQSLFFCPGSSVTINGISYNQPGTIVDTIPGVSGCDTVRIYNLQYAPGDLAVDIEEVFCQDGALKVRYSMCKLGSGPWPAKVIVLFSPQNPTAEFMSFTFAYQVNTSGADSCISDIQTISDLPISDNSPLFALINIDTISGIVSLDDFPAATDECNYYNNFDSIVVSLPDAPVLDLGPDVVLCSDSTVIFDAGSGFVSYFWQDGSSGSSFAATDPGIYWVAVTDSCGSFRIDSVLLSVSLLPDTQFPDSDICPGESLALSLPGFDTYQWAPAAGLSCSNCADVVISPAATTQYTLLATTAEGCTLRDTFVVTVKPVELLADTLEFCPGESVTIGGVSYDQSGIVTDTTTGANGCDRITTYTLIKLPQPVVFSTVEFCKGDTVLIAGNTYTQPGTVVDTIPAPGSCPTIATYTLVYLDDPDAVLTIDCIEDINIATQAGTGPVAIDYDLPITASDCICPGVSLALTEGLPSGSLFPITTTKVCYEARDSCGNTAKCCFNVTVREEQPCDVKEIGCMKYELLDISRNINTLNLTYRIRVTNKCDNRMIYTAIEIPDGVVGVAPANNSVYTSEDGRLYDVRNPNYSPFYSIRFKSTNDSIFGGNSDILQYTLPPQTDVDYIHVTSRLYPQIFYEAYLNTFNCPIELVDDTPRPGEERSAASPAPGLRVFPNPTSGVLYADLSGWQGRQLRISLIDARGQLLQQQYISAQAAPQRILLPEGLSDGLYFFEAAAENGEKCATRIVLKQ